MFYLATFVSQHSLICNNLSDLLGSQKRFPLHSLRSCSSLKMGGIHHFPVKHSDAIITYFPNLVLFVLFFESGSLDLQSYRRREFRRSLRILPLNYIPRVRSNFFIKWQPVLHLLCGCKLSIFNAWYQDIKQPQNLHKASLFWAENWRIKHCVGLSLELTVSEHQGSNKEGGSA